MKSYLKQDNIAHGPPPTHNFNLFELDFNVKFPLLRLLHFLSDLKSLSYVKLLKVNSNYIGLKKDD